MDYTEPEVLNVETKVLDYSKKAVYSPKFLRYLLMLNIICLCLNQGRPTSFAKVYNRYCGLFRQLQLKKSK
jgi:hypothetical protein